VTALHLASLYGHKETVELFIKAGGVNVNIQDNSGATALLYATSRKHKEIVKLLEKN